MHIKGCIDRSFATIDAHARGELSAHAVDDIDIHRALLFPRKNPTRSKVILIEDQSTQKLHCVSFDRFSYPSDAPKDIVPMEAFLFCPKTHRIEVGFGYLRRLGSDCVQMGFLEIVEFQKEEDAWTKIAHHKGIPPEHPLIDTAMASWKFDAHMGVKN